MGIIKLIFLQSKQIRSTITKNVVLRITVFPRTPCGEGCLPLEKIIFVFLNQ